MTFSTSSKFTALAVAISVALLGAMPIQAADTTPAPAAQNAQKVNFLETIPWDAEYDVIVLGYGFAGGAAAIAAADKGSKVLLSEKAPRGHEGGNSKYSAQLVNMIQPDFPDEKALKYLQLLRGDNKNPSDATLMAFVKGAKKAPEYLKFLGVEKPIIVKRAEYPEFEGSEGYGSVQYKMPGGDAALYHLVQKNVKNRANNIDVWFDSPGKQLIQDPETGIIHGVLIEVEGQPKYVRAKNGVILATGGYENNPQMFQNFAREQKAYAKGSKYNTGDGIIMGMDVKANMVNMAENNGPDPNVINPETGNAFGFHFLGNVDSDWGGPAFTRHNAILVGADGKRFMNETYRPLHGRIPFHNDYTHVVMPDPAFLVFDENARLASPVYGSWSKGMVDEINSGMVKKADTIEELAKIMGIDPKGLAEQIALFNQYSKDGADLQFGRRPDLIKPLDKGPFYAVQVQPTFTNTHGGPEHDETGAILDREGKRIPHLYGAGELGSIFSHKYNGTGNIGEALFFGEISGNEASKVKTDVDQGSVMKGKTAFNHVAPPPVFKLEPGEVIGVGEGMGGDIVLAVKRDSAGKITSIRVLEEFETPGIGSKAIAKLPAQAVERNGKIDNYSGATVSSMAINQAIKDALSKK